MYKPLSDEEAEHFITDYLPKGWYPSLDEIRRLLLQARRANRLVAAVAEVFTWVADKKEFFVITPIILAGLIATPCPQGDLRRASLVRVVDGDTADIRLDQGLGETLSTRIRFLGIDTPELTAKDGSERLAAQTAKAYVEKQLSDGRAFLVCIGKRDDFGRVLATVLIGGVSLNQQLLDGGYARPYKK